MVRRGVRAGALAVAWALLIGAGPASAATSPERRARIAVHYLADIQMDDGSIPGFSPIGSTADAIVSMVAARRAPKAIRGAIGYLKANEVDVDDVGETAKVILALVAAGRDPRSFEGRNLVQEIREAKDKNGRYGNLDWSYVFDQALSILSLRAAGEEVPNDSLEWLEDAQCGNGGWQFDQPSAPEDDPRCFNADASTSDYNFADTNTTSYVIQAFVATKGAGVSLPGRPWAFLKRAHDRIKGGWVFAPQFACGPSEEPPDCSVSDTNSTALVIQAYTARDKVLPGGARRALRKLQLRLCGKDAGAFAVSWSYDDGSLEKGGPDAGATIGGILGLLEKPFPLEPFDVVRAAPNPGPC